MIKKVDSSVDKWKLDLLCKQLEELLQNPEAVARYEASSRTRNKLNNVEDAYGDLFRKFVR